METLGLLGGPQLGGVQLHTGDADMKHFSPVFYAFSVTLGRFFDSVIMFREVSPKIHSCFLVKSNHGNLGFCWAVRSWVGFICTRKIIVIIFRCFMPSRSPLGGSLFRAVSTKRYPCFQVDNYLWRIYLEPWRPYGFAGWSAAGWGSIAHERYDVRKFLGWFMLSRSSLGDFLVPESLSGEVLLLCTK
jgi:hypothetical protein